MSKNAIYKITVNNWKDKNKDHKKSYKKTLISNNFCTDNKLGVLPLSHRWLFLGLLLECGSMCRDTIEMNERQLRALLESSRSVERALDALQSLQLVSYEKKTLFINRNELNRNEMNRIEMNSLGGQKSVPKKEAVDKDLNKRIWDTYRSCYEMRYKVEPSRNATVNGQISQLAKRLGEESIEVIKFYLKHNDSFYVSKTHTIGLCLKDAESLRTQWARGKPITKSAVRNFEKAVEQQELIESIRRDGV